MSTKIRWGILGVAAIATKKVIPGMKKSGLLEVSAIASRDMSRARGAAEQAGIPRAYGSYEELLADPEIDVIYNPLPNHLHVPWSIRAAEAGKHVLCEKPIALSTAETQQLIAARDRTGVKIGEAFMVRTHPQWLRARELVSGGEIGDLRLILSAFSYFNTDPNNIRNKADIGGGAIMDIGCYPITMSRWFFQREPSRVLAVIERDPNMHTDRLSSALLDFAPGQAIFSCSTQLVPYQSFQILGTKGRIDVHWPFNTPPDEPAYLRVDYGSNPIAGLSERTEEFPAVDQYTAQAEAFSAAVKGERDVPVPLEDAWANMAVIEALFRSAQTGSWETPPASLR
jgi:predicted dehydrogenase